MGKHFSPTLSATTIIRSLFLRGPTIVLEKLAIAGNGADVPAVRLRIKVSKEKEQDMQQEYRRWCGIEIYGVPREDVTRYLFSMQVYPRCSNRSP